MHMDEVADGGSAGDLALHRSDVVFPFERIEVLFLRLVLFRKIGYRFANL